VRTETGTDARETTDMTRNTQQKRRERPTDHTDRTDRAGDIDGPVRNGTTPTASDAAPPKATVLDLDGVGKSYGNETALSDLSLAVAEGEILALLGPSGCGKTTTLRLLAGLEAPNAGQLRLRGETIADADRADSRPPEDRDVGLVFQDFALFPHLTVAENVAFGLSDLDADERDSRVAELLDLVDLAGYGDRYPDECSGGQAQRVALARSLAPEPDVLLLDEPLSNLDVGLRVSMREEVHRILIEAGVTAIWVTHDQEEALSIADRVGIMHDGRLHQIGSPERVFERPATRFVASFLGQAGFLSARVEGDRLATDIGPIDCDVVETGSEANDGTGSGDIEDGIALDVLVRPDDLRVTPVTEGQAQARIVRRQYRGPSFIYRVETTGGDVLHCLHNHTESFDVGEAVGVELVAGHSLAWYPHESEDEESGSDGGGDGDDPRATRSASEPDPLQ
jgi:iron(III) transport system ATP-binding protein